MTPAEPVPYITEAEYLEGEKYAEVKHEYFDGQVYAITDNGLPTGMAGASEAHELVALNVATALVNHLRGKGCRVYKSDMKLRVHFHDQNVFYYPDVMVTCDPADTHSLFREKPKVIVEVLSENRKEDLVEKRAVYPVIESLQEYITIEPNSDAPEIRILRRKDGWNSVEIIHGAGAQFTLQSLDLTLKVSDLFAV